MASTSPLPSLHSHRTFGEFVCSDPELLLFRRFDVLNARALLYMQSELICLEARLREFDEGDEKNGSLEAMMPAVCFETILSRSSAGDQHEADRWQLIQRIQELTYQYNKMLLAQKQVRDIPGPNRRVWEVFSSWFRQKKPLYGKSGDLVTSNMQSEFVAAGSMGDNDLLTRFTEHLIGRAFAKRNSSNEDVPAYFASRTVKRLVTFVGIIGATLLLEAAIVALYLVTNDRSRFALIAVFISLFAIAVSVLSNARRPEMFAATAAYAAVLVVFVSGDLSSGGPKT
ncbi:hypothetical protein IQ06DRAFT_264843 [Phaeosphaeriaceae sp. SRC1lsM3a]|nr:hypothetical protein IQ06DRAFT_264843 [Stagonospora sp. SRC1lsM3a]